MKENRKLSIRGTILNKEQLNNYLEKIASDNILTEKIDIKTYPIKRLKDNFSLIKEVYKFLNMQVKDKIQIHPAGEWLLDNFYIIEENVKEIIKNLSLKKYKEFLALANGRYKGFARIYVLATEMVAYTDGKINSDNLTEMLNAYQLKKNLNMNEIWEIGTFIKIALIENIREICESIYNNQIQKYKVEVILSKYIFKDKKKNKIININQINEINKNKDKLAFVEYMSYKLKKLGSKGFRYLEILEEEVEKTGNTIEEMIKKEHFNIALKKVSIGNSITSLKTISRINFLEIFEKINQVEEVLKKDPVKQYEKMDNETKAYYRNVIQDISKKTKISEIYIANKCLELCIEKCKELKNNKLDTNIKEAHIGYYLISKGKAKLLSSLLDKKINYKDNASKSKIYIYGIWFITCLLSILMSIDLFNKINLINNIQKINIKITISIISFFIVLIPIYNILNKIIQYLLSKIVKPKILPKLNFENGIPKEYSTMVVIPTILDNKEKVRKLIKKLEVYYIANKSENLYFTLLGDCTTSTKEKENFDQDIMQEGIKLVKELNEKYGEIFSFVYRKRIWNEKEDCYMGWERKRGLLNELNEFLLGNIKNPFRINTINKNRINNIKYILTIDSDTKLTLKSGLKLVGAMAHILNTPVLNNDKDLVIDGYGIIEPRISIGLEEVIKSKFVEIYGGNSGTDSYTNVISNFYFDNFGEAIFTGKGIYDLKTFSTVLKSEIKENTVLSHDLLEGNYLRCGLASDILLMDDFPSNYISYRTRLYRWIRGDYQILQWLKNRIKIISKTKVNPLNLLSKYKIFSNILRSKIEIFSFLLILFSIILDVKFNINSVKLIFIGVATIFISLILDSINYLISKTNENIKTKRFYKVIDGLTGSMYRGIIDFLLIPDKIYITIKAEIKTFYRMYKSKKHLLEWVTAEDAEKLNNEKLAVYYKKMIVNVIISMIGLIYYFISYFNNYNSKNILNLILIISVLWLISPYIMFKISKNNNNKELVDILSIEDKNYLNDIAYKTWLYFKENINQENNYLPPDNYQEDRKPKYVKRTSSTNIGLALIAVISSYDLKYEKKEYVINLLYEMINTINGLSKWNGHLYNWYNIETLEPLVPRYISSVDSGNFVGYLYVLKQFLIKEKKDKNIINNKNEIEKNKIDFMINSIENIINHTDFSKLYDNENQLFSIGFNVEENKLTNSYYDLLASEARQTSLIAIAKKDISEKHWYNLNRTFTNLNNYKGLLSWSGTSFEYLMPTINIEEYPGSILDESIRFMIMSQLEYSKKLGIPWGISESAFNLKDLNNNYQYKAFGIPWLGLKRGLTDEIVVSSYGSILAINKVPKDVIKNLKILESKNMYGKYGFFESIDYTPGRTKNKSTPVKTYMAHHQALILASINNLLNKNILRKRFNLNPEIEAVNILLQEKMPIEMIITKEEKEKIEKIKYKDYEDYIIRKYLKINEELNIVNVISNNKYTIIMDQYGNGYSKLGDIQINRYKETDEIQGGIKFFIKNIKSNKIWTSNYEKNISIPDKYNIMFAPEVSTIIRNDENIETKTKVIVDEDSSVEIRRLELRNLGNSDEILEITSYLEPIISNSMQDYAHKAFNNLFLTFEYIDIINTILIKRKPHTENEREFFLAVTLYMQSNDFGEMEFEIDKEKFWGRCNYSIPKAIEESYTYTKKIGYTVNPIVALKRTVKIQKESNITLDLIISVGLEKNTVIKNLSKFLNNENIERTFEILKAKSKAENRYLEVKGKDIEIYQEILGYLLFKPKININRNLELTNASVEELWKYGISGDFPILLFKIKNVNDIDVLDEVLKAYRFFIVKNIKIDLVILNEESESYENYVKDAIQREILNKNMLYLMNVKGGIYCLNNVNKNDKKILNIRANFIIDAKYGSLELQVQDYIKRLEKNYKDTFNDSKLNIIMEDEIIDEIEENKFKNLKYLNEYGGFSNDGKEYLIKVNSQNKLPTVWSHILSNNNFGTVITESLGGYTWYKNSRLNRITAWSNDAILDTPSEIIYMKDMDTGKKWSLGFNPMHDENNYYITYGFGYAKYIHTSSKIKQKLEIFIPREDNIKINLINLENKEEVKRKIKIIYYIKPVLGEDEIKSNSYLNIIENKNSIFLENISEEKNKYQVFISSNIKINSYTGSKISFFRNSSIENPVGLDQIELDKENSLGIDGIVAIQINLTLEAFESKDIVLMIGTGKNKEECQDIQYKYSNINNCRKELSEVKKYWSNLINKIQINTPSESTNILLNGWLIYQTTVSRLQARTGFYQSGGAYGFRDQLQDSMLVKYFMPEKTRNQILNSANHQFIEGDVEHWWHDDMDKGIRTRITDDLLWLPYVTADYISFTEDYKILDEDIYYREGRKLEDYVNEKYDNYKNSKYKESLYNHCIRAIDKSLQFGENGLPKIGTGDWNDGFNKVGGKGKGESIWLGFFMYTTLNNFLELCKHKKDEVRIKKYERIMEKLKKNLNTNGWDGRWYRRAYTDEGDVLGSLQNEECKIDSISQSWSVISKAGDNDKKYIALKSLENHLIDKEIGIIKLLDPPFEKSKLNPGYIKSYLPGTRENGGQYTHAAIWTIIAQAMLNLNENAYENFKMINPIEHSRTKEECNKYKVEPYVMSADVYGQENLQGRGGWTWYTGSSSWMYIAAIKYILGINIKYGYLIVEPHIPDKWNGYEIKLKYYDSIYNIKVIRKNKNIDYNNIKVYCNNIKKDNNNIKLEKTGIIFNVKVII